MKTKQKAIRRVSYPECTHPSDLDAKQMDLEHLSMKRKELLCDGKDLEGCNDNMYNRRCGEQRVLPHQCMIQVNQRAAKEAITLDSAASSSGIGYKRQYAISDNDNVQRQLSNESTGASVNLNWSRSRVQGNLDSPVSKVNGHYRSTFSRIFTPANTEQTESHPERDEEISAGYGHIGNEQMNTHRKRNVPRTNLAETSHRQSKRRRFIQGNLDSPVSKANGHYRSTFSRIFKPANTEQTESHPQRNEEISAGYGHIGNEQMNTQRKRNVPRTNLPETSHRQSKRPRFIEAGDYSLHETNTNSNRYRNQRRRSRQGPPSTYVSIGKCTEVCKYCKAFFWYDERVKNASRRFPEYHRCCNNGKVVLPATKECPPYIDQLFQERHFIENVRAYNQMFAMTSLGAELDSSVNRGRGPYVFKVSGQIYHWIGSMFPELNKEPKFLQLYIYDTAKEVKNRLDHFKNTDTRLRRDIVENLIEVLDSCNRLVKLFRTARDKMQAGDVPEFKLKLFGVVGSKQYDLPDGDSIGAVVFEGGPDVATNYDVIIEWRGGHPQRIDKLNPHYMALHFPLLFIYGEEGYHLGLKLVDRKDESSEKEKQMTMKMYYAYQIHNRLQDNTILLRGGRLFQEYVVTAYCSVEQQRLDYIRNNQKDIRNDYMAGLYDAISRGDVDGSDVGTRTLLPASFTGGPRYMYSHYLDALAICRVHGNPSFFITFTCNVGWPEIEDYMSQFPHLTTNDRPDVVDRVFERKIHDLVTFLREGRPFGEVEAVLYTVEFQKRGLPHCHLLLWLKEGSRIHRNEDIDRYVCAELPNPSTNPEAYQVVSEFMLHGPCGLFNTSAPCMKDSSECKKGFPKPYCEETFIDKKGFVHYRRRNSGVTALKQNMQLDNTYVVPYNESLSLRFYAHINVEYCEWTMMIKYLFKYISKGTDRIIARVTRSLGDHPSSSTSSAITVDEIQNFQNARYIGPHEACWRILGFDIHSRQPAVQILAVHLENMQRVTFRAGQSLQAIVDDEHNKKTTLTEWLSYNRQSTDGLHLTYLNFPKEYAWYSNDRAWERRRTRNTGAIGRLTYVHPSAGDLFYLRMLLCHQQGCKSFKHIRTVDGHLYPTNRAACETLGLLGNDQEWNIALDEASLSATASQLRALFCQILIFCDVSNPLLLFQSHANDMSEDIPGILSQMLQLQEVHVTEDELQAGLLYELEATLTFYGKSLKDFSIKLPPRYLLEILQNRAVMEERNYDPELLKRESENLIPKLNIQQRAIFERIMNAVNTQRQELIFLYGHGGTGKTFVWKTLIYTVRSHRKIVLAVASSGIAALLLPGGRTAHSRFKLPINLTDESVCTIKKNTQLANLLKQTDLIIWDEAPMNDRKCFETLDRTFRDLFDCPHDLFEKKTVILGGDFRQTLPVKKYATKEEIVGSSITQSYLWPHFDVIALRENMRLQQRSFSTEERHQMQAFSQWLLDIGNGNIGEPDPSDPQNVSWVTIPDAYCLPDTDLGLLQLIDFIYDNESLQMPTAKSLQEKAIVCPKNETSDMINAKVLGMLHGDSHTYKSNDEAVPKTNDGGATELLYPSEYLNTLKFTGLPPHDLVIKVGAPVMLLRNLNLARGLCNGTRMIVTQLLTRVIEARIVTGTRMSQKVFIPRILLIEKDERLPFIFKRKQFPIKLCYAMTINKSQGQSLNRIGVYLPEPIFGHGQLYVALSRSTSPEGLKVIVRKQPGKNDNTTKNIVYKDFLGQVTSTQVLYPYTIINT